MIYNYCKGDPSRIACMILILFPVLLLTENQPRGNSSTMSYCANPYKIYTIKNENDMRADFCENGARLMCLYVPDSKGQLINVVLGFDEPSAYDQSTEPYYGATIGRYANRINKGRFKLGGQPYQITIKNGKHALHGGIQGFQYKRWEMDQVSDSSIVCRLHSPNGDQGFPGAIDIKVVYTINKMNQLTVQYQATTDQPTVINLTNHAFFNLNGKGSILKHRLSIHADTYTPVNGELIPEGSISSVIGTPFDFRNEKEIGHNINDNNVQLAHGKGYDHNFVLQKSAVLPAAIVKGEISKIKMKIYTAEPGLQFYSGNFMKGENTLRTGLDHFRTGFCLEPQHFPDSPNQPHFPSTVLLPGQTYKSQTIYAFSHE